MFVSDREQRRKLFGWGEVCLTHRGHLFSDGSTTPSLGRYRRHCLSTARHCSAVSPRVTAPLPVGRTHTCGHTQTHIRSFKALALPHPPPPSSFLLLLLVAFPAFDHVSADVYGPLFAVLMIIVTGWFHYPYPSDGWGLPWRPLIWVSLTTGAGRVLSVTMLKPQLKRIYCLFWSVSFKKILDLM